VKKAIGLVLVWTALATGGLAQVTAELADSALKKVKASEILPSVYTVEGATPRQEALLRTQLQVMQPDVIPTRIIFVPHWRYLYAAKMYRLHVPTGMSSKMFTHLASRRVFIDANYYGGDEALAYWMAHELGHLVANSADENSAEKAAKPYRNRLKDARLISLR
jgi:hypothetical protein